jgi:hypothetical protein
MRERGLPVPWLPGRSAYNRKNVIPEIISKSDLMPFPFATANSASGTHVFLSRNPHQGFSRTLPAWQSVSPLGNPLNALGLPGSCYDSAPGFTVVLGNPLNGVDPSGMWWCDPEDPSCEPDWPPPIFPPCIFFDCGGGGAGGGGGGNGGSGGGGTSSNTPRSTPLPPNSFPGGETLGLPPGMRVPLPSPAVLLGLNLNLNCEFGVCVGGVVLGWQNPGEPLPSVAAQRLRTEVIDLSDAADLLRDFLTGAGDSSRNYGDDSRQTRSLMGSRGFQQAFQKVQGACQSGRTSGRFAIGTFQAASNLPFDLLHSPTGAQVGGFAGATWNSRSSALSISIPNDVGANSFFYHVAPNSPFSSGPFRKIKQRFKINIQGRCGETY